MKDNAAGAEKALRDAVAASPNNPDILAHAAYVGSERVNLGTDSVEWATQAIKLNPASPNWYYYALATAAFHSGNSKLALNSVRDTEQNFNCWLIEAAAYANIGDLKNARKIAAKMSNEIPGFDPDEALTTFPMLNVDIRIRFIESLRAAFSGSSGT